MGTSQHAADNENAVHSLQTFGDKTTHSHIHVGNGQHAADNENDVYSVQTYGGKMTESHDPLNQ
jgi:hypothetical protein